MYRMLARARDSSGVSARHAVVANSADTDAVSPSERSPRDPFDDPATEPDLGDRCFMCGRDLWSEALAPAQDGSRWICGDCDQARNFEALDL